ncbi:MAG: response regulator [Syntrophus sp. (in: bacteria)]|nr:response regulator [Syntrophus sp. (in: bacteria)]
MGNILVVDDNEDMCLIISDVLRAEGHMVEIACDGESALNELKKETYNLMVLDYKLFDMNGLEVLEKLRGTTPLLDTIMISAFGSESVKARARELGVYDFIDKPFDVNVLLKAVKKALCKRQADNCSGG